MSSSSFSFSSSDEEDTGNGNNIGAANESRMVVAASRDLAPKNNTPTHREGTAQTKKRGGDERREKDTDGGRRRKKKKKKKRKRRRRDDEDGEDDDNSDEDNNRRRRKEKRERKHYGSSTSRDRTKKSRRKYHRRGSHDTSGSDDTSTSSERRRRRQDRRKRQRSEHENAAQSESQALVVVKKDNDGSKMHTDTYHEQTEQRLPRPAKGRSFASVSKTVVQVRPQSPTSTSTPLMIECGRAEEDGTKERTRVNEMKSEGGTADEPLDMIQAYRNHMIHASICDTDENVRERRRLFLPIDFEDITDELELTQKYAEKQKCLNEMVRSDPADEDAWMALANLHPPQKRSSKAAATQSKRRDRDRKKEIAGLERKREILTMAVKHNIDSFDLRVELITTLERLCLLSEIDDKIVEGENSNAIRFFEVLAAEEMRDKKGSSDVDPTRVHDLIQLHRMRLRRLPCVKGSRFNATRMRDSFIEAFSSVTKVHGDGESISPEVSVLFLDYLRMEALMGYSERAVAMIQAVLEMNVQHDNTHIAAGADNAWEASFFDYWNSEAPRIGDAYPCAGWLQWKINTRNNESAVRSGPPTSTKRGSANRLKKRVKASDFFGDGDDAYVEDTSSSKRQPVNEEHARSQMTEDRKSKLVAAYETAASQRQRPSSPKQDVEKVDRILSVARSAVEEQKEEQRLSEQIDSYEEDVKDEKCRAKISENADVETFASHANEVVPSQIQDSKAPGVQVYSFLHHRRIEVSTEELSGEATKDSLRRTLQRLRKEKKGINGDSTRKTKPSNDTTRLYMIREDDGFLQWSTEEAKSQDLFLPPLRSTQETESADYDHNRSVWIEDGIQWIAVPFLSSFDDDRGVPGLVSVCLEFLGVTFPRSCLCDYYEKNAHVMLSSTNGGERLSDVGCESPGFERAFTGVFEASSSISAEGNSFSWSDVYHQLLADESIVTFNEKLFQSQHEKERGFVRNVLHHLVSKTEPDGTASSNNGPTWTSYMQIALILFESRASGDKASEVARGILAGTEASKNDPRLWMAYAQLEFKQKFSTESVDKAYKAATKILLSALEAGGSGAFYGAHSSWWMEVACMAVRSMLYLPIDSSNRNMSSFNAITIDQNLRYRLMHVICCAIEGKFTSLPKRQKGKSRKNDTSAQVNDTRLKKCRLHLQSLLQKGTCHDIDALVTPHPSSGMFDCTPKLYHLAILAAWLSALDCDSEDIDYDSGMSILNEWASKIIELQRTRASSTCLIRLIHSQLEFALLQSASRKTRISQIVTADSIMKGTLLPSIIILKSIGLVPSRSLFLAAAFAESQLQIIATQPLHGYDFLICPFLDYNLHSNEVVYILAKAIFLADTDRTCIADEDKDTGCPATPDAECCKWARDGRTVVDTALLFAIDKAGYCAYPTLWSASLRLKLLGSLSSTRKVAKAFGEAKSFYHDRVLTHCSHSKAIWLDAFTLLRPVYSDVEMIYHMAAMEEKDIRLKKGLEAIIRMTGEQ